MKKFGGLLLISLLSITLCLNFVSATPAGDWVRNALDTAYSTLSPVFEGIIGDTPSGDLFLAKILFLIIIMIVVWLSLSRIEFFSEYPIAHWLIAIAASVLATRWIISNEIIETALLPYSALGIAISAGFPILLAFVILRRLPHTGRVMGWWFFITVFVGLWIWRSDEVSGLAYIYLIAAALSFVFLIFDRTISSTWSRIRTENALSVHNSRLTDQAMDEIADANRRFTRGQITEAERNRRVRRAEAVIRRLAP